MTDADKLTIILEENFSAFERALEERFKPALRQAIADVAAEFIDGLAGSESPSIKVEGE